MKQLNNNSQFMLVMLCLFLSHTGLCVIINDRFKEINKDLTFIKTVLIMHHNMENDNKKKDSI